MQHSRDTKSRRSQDRNQRGGIGGDTGRKSDSIPLSERGRGRPIDREDLND